jgi:ATP-dependent Clp protease adaptor protein ClpS
MLSDAGFADLHDNCKSDGSDLVFTSSDGTTKLEREVVFITPASDVGEAYVKVPSVSSSSATEIYVYYGNSGASETNSTSTWRSEYKLVSHLQTSTPTNSTAYGVDGTIQGNVTSGATGAYGDGDSYEFPAGAGDYVNYADDADWDITGALSVQLFHNDDVNTFDHVIDTLIRICKHDELQAEQCANIIHYNGECDVKSSADVIEIVSMCQQLKNEGLNAEVKLINV